MKRFASYRPWGGEGLLCAHVGRRCRTARAPKADVRQASSDPTWCTLTAAWNVASSRVSTSRRMSATRSTRLFAGTISTTGATGSCLSGGLGGCVSTGVTAAGFIPGARIGVVGYAGAGALGAAYMLWVVDALSN